MNNPTYTLHKDEFDPNDIYITTNLKLNENLNDTHFVDHRDTCPPVYRQLNLGSCTANALSCIFYHNLIKFGYREVFHPSRLYLYYNTRFMKKTVEVDDGGSLREALKALNLYGMCSENMWPYRPERFKIRPDRRAYRFGRKHKSITYFRIPQVLPQLKQCLVDGYLFACGMAVFKKFEVEVGENGGIVTLPKDDDVLLGGHAVCIVGFDDDKQVFIARNSWGPDWGDKGYFYLPYDYVTNDNLVYDIWTFRNGPEENIDDDLDRELDKPKCCCVV
jgi:C1A family cysteine protease